MGFFFKENYDLLDFIYTEGFQKDEFYYNLLPEGLRNAIIAQLEQSLAGQ